MYGMSVVYCMSELFIVVIQTELTIYICSSKYLIATIDIYKAFQPLKSVII